MNCEKEILFTVFLFARHGRALTGASPEHTRVTRKYIAEQQRRLL